MNHMAIALLFLLNICASVLCAKVDPSKTLVWGPGLSEHANLPVRYFYIQAMDKNSKPIKRDPGDDDFSYSVKSPSGARVRVWSQLLNLHNGTYIARFRPYGYGGPLTITVKYNSHQVADSPYELREVYSDDCYCPKPLTQWMAALQCPKSYPQIKVDLQPHKVIQLDGLRDKMLDRFKHASYCHYVIKDNEIYRECHGRTTDFKIFTDEILLSLTKKTLLPDIELYWNLGDWPLEKNTQTPLPMISWCGSRTSSDIVLPTYDLTGSMLNMMGRISLDVFSVQAHKAPRWKDKTEKAFFRGRDSRQERLNLCETSVANPDVVDAAITNYFFFKMNEKKHGKKVKPVSFMKFFEVKLVAAKTGGRISAYSSAGKNKSNTFLFGFSAWWQENDQKSSRFPTTDSYIHTEHIQHKYQLNIDGTVAAYRFPYLMVADSLVMKQSSDYYEHFYRQLKPNVHYLPIKHSLTDVVDQVNWAKTHDEEAHKIQVAGTKAARELLTPVNVFCYHAVVFREMANRQNGTVTVLSSMEKVTHAENKPDCNCKRKKKKSNEKAKDEL